MSDIAQRHMIEVETYVLRYGGMCRDCADENGTCPHSGIVCDSDQRRKMVRHVIEALEYGSKHGFIKLRFTALAAAEKRVREEERERAAKVAEEFEVKYADERDNHEMASPDFWMNNSGAFAAMDIAAAIRQPSTGDER